MDPRLFGLARAGIGLGAWLSPSLSARAFGLGTAADEPRGALVTRLFGVRDLALGLAVANPSTRAAALRIGVAVDAADAIATLRGRRSGLGSAPTLLVGAGAVTFAVLGAVQIRAEG